VRPKILSKDGVFEWTELLAVIVEKYPSLCATVIKIKKCVLTTIENRAHSNPQEVAIFSAHLKTKKIAGYTDHGGNDGFKMCMKIVSLTNSMTIFHQIIFNSFLLNVG
jgi:hypothetical protein